jgi:predicted membrane protein (TIGR00267 family)
VFAQLRVLLHITRSHLIARRYFVVNGFDGALTMVGLLVGFAVSGTADLAVILNVCLGAAIALGVSGVSSAYISEAAEKRSELRALERAMLSDLRDTAYGRGTRVLPLVIALVNGSAPLVMALAIIAPVWAAHAGLALPLAPLHAALAVALVLVFLLGVYLGRISGTFWLWAGLRTLLIAVLTAALVMLVGPR